MGRRMELHAWSANAISRANITVVKMTIQDGGVERNPHEFTREDVHERIEVWRVHAIQREEYRPIESL